MNLKDQNKRIPVIPPFQPVNKEHLDFLVKKLTDSQLKKIIAQAVHNIGYLQKPGHNWTVSSEKSLGLLMDYHFPNSSENRTMEYTLSSEVETETSFVHIVSDSNVYKGIDACFPLDF